MTRLRSLLLVLAAVLGAALVLPPVLAHADDAAVEANEDSFSPGAVTIEPGDTVTWINVTEDTTHNVVGNSGWPSGDQLLPPGGAASVAFPDSGSFSYYCDFHLSMFGTVEVVGTEPTTSPSPSPTETVSPEPTESPTAEPTEESPSPSPSPSPIPTVLPTFGGGSRAGQGPSAPELAASALTPPPDSPFKPPMTIFSALAVILLFAANPLLKPRPRPIREIVQPVTPRRPGPARPVRVTRN